MISQTQALTLFLSLLAFSSILKSSRADDELEIAVYWGQDTREGSLWEACHNGNYTHVILSFLNVFGCGKTPAWNFAGHCGPWNPCTNLERDIQYCQTEKNMKVLLSIGGAIGDYSLCSAQDAQDVADYLYQNFLSGQYGPLGSVTLNGIDFDIEGNDRPNLYYDDLAMALNAYSTADRKIYLAASPQCPIPDQHLDAAIQTGLFDFIYVQFYNNPSCDYSPDDPSNLFNSWLSWITHVPTSSTLFLGLPANPGAASSGYIPPNDLAGFVLPVLMKGDRSYGRVALWSRYWDIQTYPSYSDQIKSVLPPISTIRSAVFKRVSATFYRLFPNKGALHNLMGM